MGEPKCDVGLNRKVVILFSLRAATVMMDHGPFVISRGGLASMPGKVEGKKIGVSNQRSMANF